MGKPCFFCPHCAGRGNLSSGLEFMNMTEPQMLLGKIAALRERLEKTAREPLSRPEDGPPHDRILELRSRLEKSDDYDTILIQDLKKDETRRFPTQWTSQARSLLVFGKNLVTELKDLGNSFCLLEGLLEPQGDTGQKFSPALIKVYKETASMADTALRMIPNFPDSPSGQLQLCAGVEAIFQVVSQRLRILKGACARNENEIHKVRKLVSLHGQIIRGEEVHLAELHAIGDTLLQEARRGDPLVFLREDPSRLERHLACKSITLARVIARVSLQDGSYRKDALELVCASLVMDVGFLPGEHSVPEGVEKNWDTPPRQLESHCWTGSELLKISFPEQSLYAETALKHHENLDGSGFPSGLKAADLSRAVRLFSACERYVSRCLSGPLDKGIKSKSALATTLQDGEEGRLDKQVANLLLGLSFYPCGTAVELSDGSMGMVLATPNSTLDESQTHGQVIAIFREADGTVPTRPRILDLVSHSSPSILRCLSQKEKEEVLSGSHPEWN
ncbi:MAG: hypothetical protein EXR99_02440 [Gemmataceae bacterium]|nr:hypothetical protein [Gemmataceae bacterium]